MKNYDQMANDVLRRIEEQNALLEEKRENRRKAAPKVIATSLGCICVVAILGVVAWQTGWISFNKGVYIPRAEIAAEQPAVSNGKLYQYDSNGIADSMYDSHESVEENEPYIEYEGRIYTIYDMDNLEQSESLGRVNDTTSGITGNIEGEVYPVDSMDPEFMLAVDVGDNKYEGLYYLYINDNDITLRTGKDWFGDRFNVKGNIVGGTYGRTDVAYSTMPCLDEKQIRILDRFVEELYRSPFVYYNEADIEKIRENTAVYDVRLLLSNPNRSISHHLDFQLLRGGYVLINHFNDSQICIKMDDPVFSEFINSLA